MLATSLATCCFSVVSPFSFTEMLMDSVQFNFLFVLEQLQEDEDDDDVSVLLYFLG